MRRFDADPAEFEIRQRAGVDIRLRLVEGTLDTGGADQGGSERAHESRIVPQPVLFRHTVEPLGSFARMVEPGAGLALGALAVLAATALLELSRTLAETYRGRWFAGNGRDVFHAGAALALAAALLANGLPPALAVLMYALLTGRPPFRGETVLAALDKGYAKVDELTAAAAEVVGTMLLALVALGTAPPLLEPQSIVEAANAIARLLFY